ncbi:MAG: hypothetical protein QOF76_1836, partial [Solirubrobacteraceae bacterium]|nr:hypothetical protein [Solirubrobacteraceae bacterium]
PAAASAGTIDIPLTADDIDETDETFSVTVSLGEGDADVTATPATATITDDDGPPTVSIGDASATEGSDLKVPVTLQGRSSGAVVLDVTTTPGTASAADFTAPAAQLTVPAEATGAELHIAALTDQLDEDAAETLQVTVAVAGASAPASLGTATAVATILDGDAPPAASLGDVSVVEGASASVPLTLVRRSTKAITFDVSVRDGSTATAGKDFTAPDAQVTVPAGTGTGAISVATLQNQLVEPTRSLEVEIKPATGSGDVTVADGIATVTITDDDVAPSPTPTVTPTSSPTATASPTATPTASPTVTPTPTAQPLALCGGAQVALLDARGGRRLRIAGLARTELAGKTVTLRRGKRTVGTATVGAKGSFTVRVRAPKAKRASFTATVDGATSAPLRWQRRLRLLSRRGVAVRGAIATGSLRVTLFQVTGCSTQVRLGKRRVSRKHRFAVRLSRPPAGQPVALYRITARIHGARLSLPVAVPARRG